MAQPRHHESIPFDTLTYAKELQAAGFTEKQAEVQAKTFLTIVQEQLVSKRDLKDLEVKLEAKIENVRKDLKLEIEGVRKDLTLEIENVRKDLSVEIAKLGVKIEDVRKDLRVSTELLRRDLKIWFGGMLVVTITALSAMMTFLAHLSH